MKFNITHLIIAALVGFIAYNYFRKNAPTAPATSQTPVMDPAAGGIAVLSEVPDDTLAPTASAATITAQPVIPTVTTPTATLAPTPAPVALISTPVTTIPKDDSNAPIVGAPISSTYKPNKSPVQIASSTIGANVIKL